MPVPAVVALAESLIPYRTDPLGFVLDCYPWGEPGPLQNEPGPDEHQRTFLARLGEEVQKRNFDGHTPNVLPIRMAKPTGHGVGKSTEMAWTCSWIMSCYPFSRGTVTAGTATQLEERTWAEIQKWFPLCVTGKWGAKRGGDWFDVLSTIVQAKPMACAAGEVPDSWKIIAQTCKEENAQAFAGQHAGTAVSFYVFDEASQVPDAVYEVASMGLTDGLPMWFIGGQPERNTGYFYECSFGKFRDRWIVQPIDSRTSRFVNKAYIEEVRQDHGEDSDQWRVRVLGLPPLADELQYIDRGRIREAQLRVAWAPADEPLIAGLDVSGGGKARNVLRFRRGLDARSRAPVSIPGDREQVIAVCAEVMRETRPDARVAMMFVDSAFGAPVVERLHTLGYRNVEEVNFGAPSPDDHDKNMRAFMYRRSKDWLLKGAIDNSEKLAEDLSAPGYDMRGGKLVLEEKAAIVKRLGRSVDDGDAFALTFARPVAPPRKTKSVPPRRDWSAGDRGWMVG